MQVKTKCPPYNDIWHRSNEFPYKMFVLKNVHKPGYADGHSSQGMTD